MALKLELSHGRIVNLKLSKGQKKRLVLLLALAEERDIFLLVEWVADQDPPLSYTHLPLPTHHLLSTTAVSPSF